MSIEAVLHGSTSSRRRSSSSPRPSGPPPRPAPSGRRLAAPNTSTAQPAGLGRPDFRQRAGHRPGRRARGRDHRAHRPRHRDVDPGAVIPQASWNPQQKPIAGWIAPVLQWASEHGWTGTVTSGYRSYSEQASINASGAYSAPAGSHRPEHPYSGGAVDVTNPGQLIQVLKGYAGPYKLVGGVLGLVHPEQLLGHRPLTAPVSRGAPGPARRGQRTRRRLRRRGGGRCRSSRRGR